LLHRISWIHTRNYLFQAWAQVKCTMSAIITIRITLFYSIYACIWHELAVIMFYEIVFLLLEFVQSLLYTFVNLLSWLSSLGSPSQITYWCWHDVKRQPNTQANSSLFINKLGSLGLFHVEPINYVFKMSKSFILASHNCLVWKHWYNTIVFETNKTYLIRIVGSMQLCGTGRGGRRVLWWAKNLMCSNDLLSAQASCHLLPCLS